MRVVVFGVGAVGGTIAARLADSGTEVAGIARGAMLDAIRADGLRLRSPAGTLTVRFPCFATPAEVDWRPDDVVMLTMKGQHTEDALRALRNSGVDRQAIVCAQNGVANERAALRLFPVVFGMTVMLPALYDTPGEVIAFGTPRPGLLDLGRYPRGLEGAGPLAEALDRAGFGMHLHADVMASKHGKLLMNLGNILGAALGEGASRGPWYHRARAEAEAALAAAGQPADDVDADNPRRADLQMGKVDGAARAGSSTQQSLARGTGSIETDFLNGEVVLLGRLHGVPTPVNAALCEAARRMVAARLPVGSFPEPDLAALVTAAGG